MLQLRSPSRRRQSRAALTAVLLGALALAGFALGSNFMINLTSAGPQPATQTAALGDTVTFVNQDSAPYVIEAPKTGLTTPTLTTGQSFTYVLTTTGQLSYRQKGSTKSFPGEIVVKRAGEVTLALAVRRPSVPFGANVILVGSTALAAFPVVIQQKPSGEKVWADLVTVTPSADGSFSTTVRPPGNIQYRASVLQGELLSKPVALAVRPLVTLRASKSSAPTGTSILLTAGIAPETAAKSVTLMRYNRDRNRWQKVMVRAVSGNTVTFFWPIERGRSLLRAWLTKRDLYPGFAPSFSRQILVTGADVKPLVTLRASKSSAPTGTSTVLTARIVPATAAKSVTLLRYNRDRARWQKVMKRGVSRGKATFRWPVEEGRSLLRAWLAKRDLNPGFAPSFSRQILVTGVGQPPSTRKGKRR